jgi:hypothetical protein
MKMIKLTDLLKEDETQDPQEIVVRNYQTRHYDMCPGATTLYKDIEEKVDDMDLAERTAKLQDVLFYMEKHIIKEMKGGKEDDVLMAQNLADQIMEMAGMMGLDREHGYIQGHVDAIEKVVNDSQQTNEDLGKWFGSGKEGGWDRYSTTGDKLGKCGDAEEGEPYSACLSNEKAKKLGKKGRASFVRRKRDAQKKAGDAKKGGEQSKGQKPTYVKTGA